jgi:ankyrin repeat protein
MMVRSLIEEATQREPKLGEIELLSEAYGEYYFKCPVFTCAHFQQGFPSREKREAHVKVHKREYKCPHENCAFHITGFISESGLESHLSYFHDATQLPYMFPHLEPKAAWQIIEEAIDHDDARMVRNWCLDSLDLPDPPQYLLRAVKKGSFASARVLAEYPVLSRELYNQSQIMERSPLCLAAAKGESELTGYFLSLVADEQIPFQFWRTTFPKLIKEHRFNVVRTISESGKDLGKVSKYLWNLALPESFANVEDEETEALLFQRCLKSNISRKQIENIATAVAKKGDRALVKRLFEFQENNDFPNNTNFTSGLEKVRTRGIDAMVECIMERAGGVVDSKGKTWGNALQKAARDGDDEKVQMLIDGGANVNYAESGLGTALQAAARNGHESTVLLLLGQGADPFLSTDSKFGSPLAEAAASGDCRIISILLKAGVIPSTCQEKQLRSADRACNSTPLHFAAKYAHVDAITLLLENGASASALDDRGNSTLHYMAKNVRPSRRKPKDTSEDFENARASLEILVDHGADITAENSNGNTALHELWEANKYDFLPQKPRIEYLLELSASFIRSGADLSAKNGRGLEIRDIAKASSRLEVREAVGKISRLRASEQI